MNKIIDENICLTKSFVPRSSFINNHSDPIKKYIAANLIEEEEVSIYTQGDFYDLCRGPHVLCTGMLKNKLWNFLELSEVTWHEFQMQRLSFEMFNTAEEKKIYDDQYSAMCDGDHRVLCKELEICLFPSICSGMVLWQPNGLKVIENLKNLIRQAFGSDYQFVHTPAICKNTLWEKTGHLSQYGHLMFKFEDESLKPMNCPEHTWYFSSRTRSYKELPVRIFEFGTCFRNEHTGGLLGLKRLRSFTQDDGHIFCTLLHAHDEILKFMRSALNLYVRLGFTSAKIVVATRPEKSIGSSEEWNEATEILHKATEEIRDWTEVDIEHEIDVGGGAFYGPKIEVHVKDNKGKFWQCGTIQVDFFLATRLNATYVNEAGQEKHPIVLHRAALGSIERFLAVLIEHWEGLPKIIHFCPVVILPVSNSTALMEFCHEILQQLQKAGIASEICSKDTLPKRIKVTHQKYRPYYQIIVGDRELKDKTLCIREKNQQYTRSIEQFIGEYFATC